MQFTSVLRTVPYVRHVVSRTVSLFFFWIRCIDASSIYRSIIAKPRSFFFNSVFAWPSSSNIFSPVCMTSMRHGCVLFFIQAKYCSCTLSNRSELFCSLSLSLLLSNSTIDDVINKQATSKAIQATTSSHSINNHRKEQEKPTQQNQEAEALAVAVAKRF